MRGRVSWEILDDRKLMWFVLIVHVVSNSPFYTEEYALRL